MAWPLSQDYNEAIQSASANFADPDLRRGTATVNALGLPVPFSGNFADVYRVECPDGGRWAVKCFTREVPHLRERYQEISRFLGQVRFPFTVDFRYLEDGIRVRGRWYPVLKMQWVEGLTFNAFVRQFLDKPRMLEAVLRLWARMAKYLRSAGAAHGDLQHGNILLVPGANANALALKLIDYDGMFVPALAGSKSGEVGHPSYQHPQRLRDEVYSLEVDRFPLLLIATALSALKVKGQALWKKYDNADNLIFREADLRDPGQSELFRELSRIDDPTTAALTDAVRVALKSKLERTPLLEEVIPDMRPAPAVAVAVVPKRTAAIASITAQQPTAEGLWDFSESIVTVSAAEPSRAHKRRKKEMAKGGRVPVAVWIGGAAAAAFVVLGGGTALALALILGNDHAKGPDNLVGETKPILADLKTVRETKPERETILAEEVKPEGEAKSVFPADEKIGEVRRFEVDERRPDQARLAAVSPDGTKLVRAFGANVGVWRIADARMELQTDKGNKQPNCISVDPTGHYAALGNYDGLIEIWDLKDLKLKTTLSIAGPFNRGPPAFAVAFSPDGKRLLSAGPDPNVHQWDWDKGVEVGGLEQEKTVGWSISVTFTPDGKHYLIGTTSGIIRVMRVDGNKEIARFEGPSCPTHCLAVAPDNRRAVSGSEDGSIRVWDLRTATELAAFKKHQGPVKSVAVSPDGRWVLSGGDDQVLWLWELDNGRENHRFSGHKYAVASVGFFKDGRHAFSSGNDNVVRIWRLPSPDAGPAPPTELKTPETKPIAKKLERRERVPDVAALAAAEAEVKETYKAELAKRERQDLLKLSGQFSRDGANSKEKPAAIRYVLLREARDLAAKAGDFRLAMIMADGMAQFFAVDAWDMKADALEQADSKSYNVAGTRDAKDLAAKTYYRNAASHALVVADSAIEQDALGAAERMVKAAQTYAGVARDVNLNALIPARIKELSALRKAYEGVPEAQDTLTSRGDASRANFVVGRYYALAKGDWDKGVSFLARGNDAKLSDLAKSDLECALDADAMTELGDHYATHAESEDGAARTHTQWRACYWYERAEGLSKGPSRAKVAARRTLVEKAVAPSRPIVLYARYGANASWVDATESLRRFLLSGAPKLAFPSGVCAALEVPDPAFGEHKTLIIVYRHRGRVRVSATGDSDAIRFPEPADFVDTQPGTKAPGQDLAVLCARYGADGTFADVTSKLQQAVKGLTLAAKPADLDIGDPIPGRRKWLIIVYRYRGRVFLNTVGQDEAAVITAAPP